jgi:uncharacterized protein (UPF0371 family)
VSETKYVVIEYPTIMDGIVVRWFASVKNGRGYEQIISASRNGVTKHIPGPAADMLETVAMEVHDQIHQRYYGSSMEDERPWAHLLTHRDSSFGSVTPLAGAR